MAVKEQFGRFIQNNCKDAAKAEAIIEVVGNSLLSFLKEHFEDITADTIFELQDSTKLKEYQSRIQSNGQLLFESGIFPGTTIIEAISAYRRFLESPVAKVSDSPSTSEHTVSEAGEIKDADNTEDETSREIKKHTEQEGEVLRKSITFRNRNRSLRDACIEHYKESNGHIKCQCCGFDFEEHYGTIGKGYIEVHHIQPIADTDGAHEVNPETDLIPLCANCHAMIHRGPNGIMLPEELKNIYNQNHCTKIR